MSGKAVLSHRDLLACHHVFGEKVRGVDGGSKPKKSKHQKSAGRLSQDIYGLSA